MRIAFDSIEQPKHMAKLLAASTAAPLMKCQQVFAKSAGYRDWRDLSKTVGSEATGRKAMTLSMDEKVDLALQIAQNLQVDPGNVHFALSQMNAFGWQFGITEQLDIAAKIFRRTSIPDLGRRQPGSVGKFKRDGSALILRSFGRPVSVVSHKTDSSIVADSEFVTPKVPIPLFIPARLYFAYGVWTESDGALVLFSRDYIPLWRLRDGQVPRRVNPSDWINHVSQQWFWDDEPWDISSRHKDEIARLESYKVTGLPHLTATLPDLVLSRDPIGPRMAVEQRFGRDL